MCRGAAQDFPLVGHSQRGRLMRKARRWLSRIPARDGLGAPGSRRMRPLDWSPLRLLPPGTPLRPAGCLMDLLSSPRPLRVLVVDDNEDTADVLVSLADLWGHDVRVAYSGPAALRVARAFQPHLVLLDI